LQVVNLRGYPVDSTSETVIIEFSICCKSWAFSIAHAAGSGRWLCTGGGDLQALTTSRNISTEAFDSLVSISKLLCVSGVEFFYITLTLLHVSNCGCGLIALLFVGDGVITV